MGCAERLAVVPPGAKRQVGHERPVTPRPPASSGLAFHDYWKVQGQVALADPSTTVSYSKG